MNSRDRKSSLKALFGEPLVAAPETKSLLTAVNKDAAGDGSPSAEPAAPARASAVLDAVSEGLANAVRHGDGSLVSVELRTVGEDGVEVVIRSGGRLHSHGPGIGLKQLAEHGTVALREAAGRVELAVAIP